MVADLVKTKDLKNALDEVAKIYAPKRKRIQLDAKAINEVQKQDKGTVELLNEYLNDEFEDETATIKSEGINDEEIQIEIETKQAEEKQSAFIEGIALNEVQASVLALFAEKSFNISFTEVDAYCKSLGAFRNRLIDSINESCYEVLDDILIEEEGDNYTINESYYKK